MIYLGSDHASFELKGKIRLFPEKAGYALEDMGPHAYEPEDDYPDFALQVCRKVIETNGKGILICGTAGTRQRSCAPASTATPTSLPWAAGSPPPKKRRD